MRHKILILYMLIGLCCAQTQEQDYVLASIGTCIDYMPKTCELIGGICYDRACPDCICRIWVSDDRGDTILINQPMKVSASKTCCYIANEPPFMKGKIYSVFFNAESPTLGSANMTAKLYITLDNEEIRYGNTLEVGIPTVEALPVSGGDKNDFCNDGVENSCEYLNGITCTDLNDWTAISSCYLAKTSCAVSVGGTGIDVGNCYIKYVTEIFKMFTSVIGAGLSLIKGMLGFVIGMADSETREQTLNDTIKYLWDFMNTFIMVLAPIFIVAELFIIYSNASKPGVECITGFISDNFRFITVLGTIMSFIANIFISIFNMFTGLLFGARPK